MLKNKNKERSFLDIHSCGLSDLKNILELAIAIKSNPDAYSDKLKGMSVAVLLMKNSTRTRVSFEVGIRKLGANPLILNSNEMQLSRNESTADTARVLSKYVDMIAIRCFEHSFLTDFDFYSSIPVINALTDNSHPCQIMADILTYVEHRGDIASSIVTWAGSCNNNVLNSWIHASKIFGFEMIISSPNDPNDFIKNFNAMNNLSWEKDILKSVVNADIIVTDSWVSMGEEHKHIDEFKRKMALYSVNANVIARAKKDVMFMHCLPAHRGEEVTDDVIDSDCSYVLFQAENRLYIQQAIMLWCFGRI